MSTKIEWCDEIATGRFCQENNNNWRGGRLTTPHGYVVIRVGPHHHLANVGGYAYEHRLVAEKMLRRRLLSKEQVHHINGKRDDNRVSNIEVFASLQDHRVAHRMERARPLRLPGEDNPQVVCGCGCGETFAKYDSSNRPRMFVSGHNTGCRR